MIRLVSIAALLFCVSNATAVTYLEVVNTAEAHWPMQDDTGNNSLSNLVGDNGTIIGRNSDAITTDGPIVGLNKGLNFRGSYYAQANNLAPGELTQQTICVWIRTDGSQATYAGICGRDNLQTLMATGSGFKYNWTTSGSQYGYNSPTIPFDTWTHVTLRVKPDRAEFFYNGVLVGTNVTPHAPINKNNTFYIARSVSNFPWFSGDLADLQVYHRPLTDDEIMAVSQGPGAPSVQVGDAHVREITPAERAQYGPGEQFVAPGWERFSWPAGANYNAGTRVLTNDSGSGPQHITVGLEATRNGSPIYLLVEIEGDAKGNVKLNDPNTFFETEQGITDPDFPLVIGTKYYYDPAVKTSHQNNWATAEEQCVIDSLGSLFFKGTVNELLPGFADMLEDQEIFETAAECGCDVNHKQGEQPGEDTIQIICPFLDCDNDEVDDRQDDDAWLCGLVPDCDGDGIPDTEDDDSGPGCDDYVLEPYYLPDPLGDNDDAVNENYCSMLSTIIPSEWVQNYEDEGCWDIDRDGICDECDADAQGYYRTGCGNGPNGTGDCRIKGWTQLVDRRSCLSCTDDNENGICDECEREASGSNSLNELLRRLRIVGQFNNIYPRCETLKVDQRYNFGTLGTWYLNWAIDTCFDYYPATTRVRTHLRLVLVWFLRLYVLSLSLRLLWGL